MNFWMGSGLVALAAGLLWFFVEQEPADVYNMPVESTYSRLANVDFSSWSSEGRSSVGNGRDKVTWRSVGAHSRRSCELALAPFEGDPNRTHVTVTCDGGSASDGAASGIAHNMFRDRVIEMVDATLTGRTFDENRAGETAHRWPSDGVDGSYGTAVARAVEMDRQVREMQAAGPVIEDYDPGVRYDSEGYVIE